MGKRTSVKPARLTRPNTIKAGHNLETFDCGSDTLNVWLRKHAFKAQLAKTATTMVVSRGRRVVGYFSLANGAVAHAAAKSKARRNTPDPIPAIILARLAVHLEEQGRGLGGDLLADAMKRALAASRYSAANLLVVHPLNEKASAFYADYGFQPLKAETSAISLPVQTVGSAM